VSRNADVVRAGLEAFERREFDRALERVHPEVASFRAPPLPDPQTYKGPAGVGIRQRHKGRASGAPVEGTFWFVFTLADGSITRQDVYATRDRALAAAGMPDGP
jgi:ketosteroid isomerase-like protein